MPRDPYADVRQMTPAAQRKLGGYVRHLIELEARLRKSVLTAGSTTHSDAQAVIAQVRTDLIDLHRRQYITFLSVDSRTAERQIMQMVDQDIESIVRRAQAVLDTV